MTTLVDRPRGCLAPVLVDAVVDRPEDIVQMARDNGPYFMPARYLIGGGTARDASETTRASEEVPAHLIGPVWRGDWAFGEALVPGAERILHHGGFIETARAMYQADVVVPHQVYINLTGPMGGNPFSHVDIPEFVGIDRSNAPGWFLQAMGSSGLFEDVRISIVTAVAWFHRGPRGFFRYWPGGRDAASVRQENMWNTAVVGDNDFMHHKVERVGSDNSVRAEGLTIDTAFDHDGEGWVVLEDDVVLARYEDPDVRLSVSWKAKVYADESTRQRAEAGAGGLDMDEALRRFATEVGFALPDNSSDALSDPKVRELLSARWSGYRSD